MSSNGDVSTVEGNVAKSPDLIVDGWFRELSPLWPGEHKALQVKAVVHHARSQFQDILIFDSTHHGRVLVLDGVIQTTEHDEFAYQECMSHIPLCAHPNPENVLIIGGGDGGVAREVAKHPRVKNIVQCEIDSEVVRLCREHIPSMGCGFDSPKMTLTHEDGFVFMKSHESSFDVVITDSSDPIGPAESLFQEDYYRLVSKSLKPGGIMCCQGESMWLHLDLIKSMMSFCRGIFPVVSYGMCQIPTYPSGMIGLLLASKDTDTDFTCPTHVYSPDVADTLRYYTPQVHKAAFALPAFAHRALIS